MKSAVGTDSVLRYDFLVISDDFGLLKLIPNQRLFLFFLHKRIMWKSLKNIEKTMVLHDFPRFGACKNH